MPIINNERMNIYSYHVMEASMRKIYKLDGELCANCAGKIQAAAEKLDGMNRVSVNAMTYKLTIDSTDDTFDANLEKVIKLFADIEPDCEVLL